MGQLVVVCVGSVIAFALLAAWGPTNWWLIPGGVAVTVHAVLVSELYNRRSRRRARPRTAVSRQPVPSRTTVCFDDRRVTVLFDGHERESVAWDDVARIWIQIENEGFVDMPYWVVQGSTGGCAFPNDANGREAVMDQFERRLPGFGRSAYLAISLAMAATSGVFEVWQPGASQGS